MYQGFEGQWSWMHNGAALTESFWGEKHPNNKTGNKDDCGVLVLRNNQFSWEDRDCLVPLILNHAVAPVCQHDTAATSTTAAPETTTALSCPSGWTEFQGNCYRYFSTFEYWMNAEKYCRDEDASLVSVHSTEEANFLATLSGNKSFWIGAYRSGSNDIFWSDLSENDFTDFYDSATGCLYYYAAGKGWTGTNCHSTSSELAFICKKLF